MNFYGGGLGDRLIDESVFPKEIKEFLRDEENLLLQISPSFNTLIEVGCMHGRYVEWAVKHNLRYIGIDVVHSYINEGTTKSKTFNSSIEPKFILGGAEELHILLNWETLGIDKTKALLFFPFNSIGNMNDCIPVITSIRRSGAPFFISTYSTTPEVTLCRQKYYSACNYRGLYMKNDERGVTFISDDGLNTIAYHPEFIINVFRNKGLIVKMIGFSAVGIAYVSTSII